MLSSKTPTHLFSISTEPRATHKMKENHERCFLWSEGTKWASKHLHLKKKKRKKPFQGWSHGPWAVAMLHHTVDVHHPFSAHLSQSLFFYQSWEKKKTLSVCSKGAAGPRRDPTCPTLPRRHPCALLCFSLWCSAAEICLTVGSRSLEGVLSNAPSSSFGRQRLCKLRPESSTRSRRRWEWMMLWNPALEYNPMHLLSRPSRRGILKKKFFAIWKNRVPSLILTFDMPWLFQLVRYHGLAWSLQKPVSITWGEYWCGQKSGKLSLPEGYFSGTAPLQSYVMAKQI